MSQLEDIISSAMRAKADEIAPGSVPPLRLPAGRRRSLRRPGGRAGAPPRRSRGRLLAPAAAAVMVAAVVAGLLIASRGLPGPPAAPAAGQRPPDPAAAGNQAAAWVAAEVSSSASVSCDPAMCRALAAHGIAAGRLHRLGARFAGQPRSDVIVATPADRREPGARLSAFYAPLVIASFGQRGGQVEVRVVAPQGAAAYRRALQADLAARRAAGSALILNGRIRAPAAARRQLAAGRVDSRLLVMLAVAASRDRIAVAAFGDPGPGAGAGGPLRSVTLADPGHARGAGRSARLTQIMRILLEQPGPYRPARADMLPSRLLRVEVAAPSPLGLLSIR